MKFKVGDKVRVVKQFLYFHKDMQWPMVNKVFTIVDDDGEYLKLDTLHLNIRDRSDNPITNQYILHSSAEEFLELVEDDSFPSQQEIFEWLVQGNKVTPKNQASNAIIGFKEGVLYNYTYKQEVNNRTFNFFQHWKKYREPNWWENIPEKGILCWVSSGEEDKDLQIVIGYTQYQNYPFRVHDGGVYSTAIPLTEEEVRDYIYMGGTV